MSRTIKDSPPRSDDATPGRVDRKDPIRGRCLVIHPDIPLRARSAHVSGVSSLRAPEARLEEACGLARAIELDIFASEVVAVKRPQAATLLGGGVIERLAETVTEERIEVVIIDAELTPGQQRSLEKAWYCKVIDRTGLILEIFGARARTREGRLQVDLAALTYQRSRLVRSWTHLERQRGGVGFMGGPGESQLEIDRRLIDEKITRLKADLEQVRRTRDLHRKTRRDTPYPIVALVGYTNAGKSTLFNRLTRAEVFQHDMLFATLDPTMRRLRLPQGQEVILSDTVGFISDLPTHLVAAFRATLEEVLEADLILHVRDISHPDTAAQKADVEAVLRDLGVEDRLAEDSLEVLNKIDRLDGEDRAQAEAQAARQAESHLVSAETGEGCAALIAAIEEKLTRSYRCFSVELPVSEGAAIAWLYERGQVLGRKDDETHARLSVRLAPEDVERFQHRFHRAL